MTGVFAANFMRLLESRLDNALFRVGLAKSRRVARQLVSHGHVLINGKTVTIPSYQVRVGEVISLKERTLNSSSFSDLDARLKTYTAPQWIELDKEKKLGVITRLPEVDQAEVIADVTKVKEFYSR